MMIPEYRAWAGGDRYDLFRKLEVIGNIYEVAK